MKIQYLTVAALLLAGLSNAWWNTPQVGDPCRHYSGPCREKTLVSEETTPCTTCGGPNVCITSKTYTKHYYSAFYEEVCQWKYNWWGRYRKVCRLQCEVSNSCNITKNVTRTEYSCCKGFTTNNTHHGSYEHFWNRRSHWFLKRYGCPVVVHNSTFDCLIELGLTEFANLFSDTLRAQVGNDSAKRPKYTIFAPPNEIVRREQLGDLSRSALDVKIKSHIIRGRQIHSDLLYNGKKKMSMAEGRFVHVSESYGMTNTTTYINCQKLIAPDACQAENGIVHVIQGVICSSNNTIADIINSTSQYSILASLFRKANLLKSLNSTHGFPLTLFAPTNDAISAGSNALSINLERCLNNFTTSELYDFLKYHYACNAECSSVLVTKTEIQTEACKWEWSRGYWWRGFRYRTCKKLRINVNDEGIQIGETGSSIRQADIPASNGIIHAMSLPLVNPCLNLTKLCSGFTVTPPTSSTPSPSSTPSQSPTPSMSPSPSSTPSRSSTSSPSPSPSSPPSPSPSSSSFSQSSTSSPSPSPSSSSSTPTPRPTIN